MLIVDDSSTVRALLSRRLTGSGYDVEEASDGETGVEKALASPPDVVVTDLHMKGISGVHLCRILRFDAVTSSVPVVLLTASGDKRSRFWARTAGAAAYIGKDRLDDLVDLLPKLLESSGERSSVLPPASSRTMTLHERMSAVLDSALSDSVISGEVRALASAGEPVRLFEALVTLMAEVISYRWMALLPARAYEPLFLHVHPSDRAEVEAKACSAVEAPSGHPVHVIADERAVAGGGGLRPHVLAIRFAGTLVGRLAVAPTARGLTREDQRTLALVASELAGPLQMSALYQDAQRLATLDGLTGILNRRAFLDVVERERIRADRHGHALSVLLLDIDHFKSVNDRRGHAAGDAVLKGVAGVLTSVARKSDLVARWGGEEFVVALVQTSDVGARIAAERVRRAIADASFPAPDGEALRVTASIGISSGEPPWQIEPLVAAADLAMYAAKERGRNRVEAVAVGELPTSVRRLRTIGGTK